MTGARIGEVLACRYGTNADREPLLDLEAGTWEVNATIVRVSGEGLIVQERTKSEAGWRVLALPPACVEMLRRRETETRLRAPQGVVFGSIKRRTLRDPSNTAADLKEVLGVLGYDWVTFHTFRKTVATRMKAAGCTDIEVADQLGHSNPSMTRNVYMGRNVVTDRAASVLQPA
jgi:integrase